MTKRRRKTTAFTRCDLANLCGGGYAGNNLIQTLDGADAGDNRKAWWGAPADRADLEAAIREVAAGISAAMHNYAGDLEAISDDVESYLNATPKQRTERHIYLPEDEFTNDLGIYCNAYDVLMNKLTMLDAEAWQNRRAAKERIERRATLTIVA